MFKFELVALLAALTVSSVCADCTNYKCVPENNALVTIKDKTYECANKLVCNRFQAPDCLPCVLPTAVCKHVFTCTTKPNEVQYEKALLICPAGKVCNATPSDNCNPCVPMKCPAPQTFKCDPTDPSKVIIGDTTVSCPDKTVCNKDFVQPCGPCIPSEAEKRTLFYRR